MFLCLLDEVVSYLFYSKRSTEVYWWIHANHLSPQRTKRRGGRDWSTGVFLWILQNFWDHFSLWTPLVAASDNEHNETKQLHMTSRLNNCYHWMTHYNNYFGNPSKWTQHFSMRGQKLKWDKTKWITPFL